MVDVAIIGGGPAGLVAALEARARGLSTVVLERHVGAVDKACGEGLMPAGLAVLQRLGVTEHFNTDDCAPFETITYLQNDGRTRAEGRLPSPGGLGVRRLALSAALRKRATEVGATLREGVTVTQHEVLAEKATLQLSTGETMCAALVIAADGLHSATRTRAGLAGPAPTAARRYGLRQHFHIAPWAKTVEVHFASGIEAYVTPVGARRVGVAFLWAQGSVSQPSISTLLASFPSLAARLAGTATDSSPRGAGPLLQQVTRRTAPRLALLGDAAGYVDAITGEGLTLAFCAAEALGHVMQQASTSGTVEALAHYERTAQQQFTSYARLASALVWVSQHAALRQLVVSALALAPPLLTAALHLALPKPTGVR